MSEGLEGLRLGAALVHALPGCRLELRGADGASLDVGFDPRCECTPCDLRNVLCTAVLANAELDLPVSSAGMEVALHDDPPGTCHVGLGVYRYREADCFGFAFATVLEPLRIAAALLDRPDEDELPPDWQLHFQADEGLGVTLLFTQHPAHAEPFLDAVERHVLHAATACLAAELCDASARR